MTEDVEKSLVRLIKSVTSLVDEFNLKGEESRKRSSGPKLTKEQINKMTEYIMEGLTTDGGHHKQWYLEQALLELHGEDWIDTFKEYGPGWEEGIP